VGGVAPSIRPAETHDAEAIARIQLDGWRTAYRAIMPPEFLASQDSHERAERWRGRLGSEADPAAPTFVTVEPDGRVTGFVHTGPLRDDDLGPEGRAEIYTIYVAPEHWGRGVGSLLLTEVDAFWRPRALSELVLWVFEQNLPARRFYEHRGWHPDGTSKVDEIGAARPIELRYRRRFPK
jgi:GNAT superfamily N-acetyltransferase